jgi:hypothetical protein
MQGKSLKIFDRQIRRLQDQLAALGPMRPGALTRQYREPREKKGGFWQISYTRQMKSRSEYVRPSEVAAARQEIAAFRRFKKLTARWVELALARSQTRTQQARAHANPSLPKARKRPKTAACAIQAPNIHPPE